MKRGKKRGDWEERWERTLLYFFPALLYYCTVLLSDHLEQAQLNTIWGSFDTNLFFPYIGFLSQEIDLNLELFSDQYVISLYNNQFIVKETDDESKEDYQLGNMVLE